MKMELVGYKSLDFESNGERVKGTQAFVAFEEEGVEGKRTDKLFFRDGFELPGLNAGMTLEVSFNRKGKPESVTIAQPVQRLNIGKQ